MGRRWRLDLDPYGAKGHSQGAEEHHKELERDRADRAEAVAELQRQKRERINDIVTALHAEILAGILLYASQTDRDEVRSAVSNLTPFATPDETDFVFDSVKSEISILPSEVIHAVVAYYRSAQQTNLIIRDLRDETFKSQSAREKEKFLKGYISLTVLLKRRGDRGVEALADYARANGFSLDASQRQIESDTRKAMASARACSRRPERDARTPVK